MTDVDALFAAVEALATDAHDADACWRAAQQHRVDLLAAHALVSRPAVWPALSRARLSAELRDATAVALAHEQTLQRLLAAWTSAGVRPILLKGEALAYTHYEEPYLRRRTDIDVLVRPEARAEAEAVLRRCGFDREADSQAEVWNAQSHWRSTGTHLPTAVDLHWRPVNAVAFAEALPLALFERHAVPSPAHDARVPGPELALLFASVHRVAHHYDAPLLLWLFDLHVLVRALGPHGVERTCALALDLNLGPVLARSLRRTHEALGTPLDGVPLEQLERGALGAGMAPFLSAPSGVRLLWSDARALGHWSARVALLREHLLPPVAYMRTRYPRLPRWALPVGYVDRVVRGLPAWLRRR